MHDPTIYLVWSPCGMSNVYWYKYGYSLPLNVYRQHVRWHSRLERQSSEREVVAVASSPAVGKKFSFCNSHFGSQLESANTNKINHDIRLAYTLF